MKYEEVGFRAIYHNFCAFSLNESLREHIKEFPGADTANCILTYGYIDKEAGLTLDILAAGIKGEDGYRFFGPAKYVRVILRIGSIAEESFALFSDKGGGFSKRYSEKLEMIHEYDADEMVERTRYMTFLDRCRHAYFPDDIMVVLMHHGLIAERVWVRISGFEGQQFHGSLLNEPQQNFGIHTGDEVKFSVVEIEKEEYYCFSDL